MNKRLGQLLCILVSFCLLGQTFLASTRPVLADAIRVVYLNGSVESSGNGTTPEMAVKTLGEAYSLLDADNAMAQNIIVVCGDTAIDLSSTVTLPAKEATITGAYGDTDYEASLAGSDGNGKISLQADTTIENLNFSFVNASQLENKNHKLILKHTGSTPTVAGSDIEVYSGTYVNVYADAPDGDATLRIYGGTISNLAISSNSMNKLNILIAGGTITNVYGGRRWGSVTIDTVNITLEGAPKIAAINGKYNLAQSSQTESWLNFCEYSGNFGYTLRNIDHIAVSAAEGETAATFSSLQAAYANSREGGTIVLRAPVVIDQSVFSGNHTGTVEIIGETAGQAVTFTTDCAVFTGDFKFDGLTLNFSQEESSPTILFHPVGKAPVFTSSTVINGYYQLRAITASGGDMNLDFGEKLTQQEINGYAAITGSTAYERFQQTIAGLPEEVPVLAMKNISAEDYGTVLYVAPDGSDTTGDGSLTSPFATPKHALEAVTQLSVLQRAEGVAIFFREGKYAVTEGLAISDAHGDPISRTKLTLAAYENENVAFVGGSSLTGSDFQLATETGIGSEDWNRLNSAAKGKVYVADLAQLGLTEYYQFKEEKNGGAPALTVNGTQMTIARYPDVGEVTIKRVIDSGLNGGSCFELQDTTPLNWKNTGRIYVRGSFWEEWWKTVGRITEINAEQRSIKTNGYLGWSREGMKAASSNTHYYYNVLEELSIPGEWFLDEDTDRLYVYPMDGAMQPSDVVCTTTTSAEYLVTVSGASNVLISGITFEVGNGGIRIENSENVLLQRCTVQDMSSYGVDIYESFKCGMTYSTIRRTSYVAFQSSVSAQTRRQLTPSRCFLQNSLIQDIQVTACQILGVGDIFSHNTVQYTRSMGVSVVGTECILEYNEMTAQSYAQRDAGAFYVSGAAYNVGNVIRHNYIHDSNPPGTNNARGIYMDDGCSGNYAYENVVENMSYGIFVHCGDDNVYKQNTLIDCHVSAEVSDGASTTANLASSTYYSFYNGMVNWYAQVKDGPWETRYPYYEDMAEKCGTAIEAWEDNDTENATLAYVRAATGNTFTGNKIINSPAINTNTYAAPYTVLSDNQNLSLTTEEEKLAYTRSSDLYEKLGFTNSQLPGDALAMGSPLSLLTPTQNESVNAEQVNFKWKKLGGVNFYVLTIAKDANFTQDVRDFTTSEAEYKVELAGYEQEYYWKVQAISLAKYNYGQTVTSAVGSFVFTLGTGLSATDVRYYTPDVDGVRDAAYASSARMVLGQEYQASPDASAVPATDTTATGYLIWDENNLYVYADVNKTGIFSNPLLNGGTSENAYLQDCVQIDLQTKNSQLYSVIVHGDGDGYYCTLNGWTGDAKYAVVPKADGSGYSVEFAVPFGEGMQAGDEVEIRFRETSADATRWANYLEQVAAGTATAQQAPVFRYGNSDVTTYTLSSETWSEESKILRTAPVVDGRLDTAYLRSARTELGPMCYALLNDVEEQETTGFLYMLWDDTNLYYYADISTASINSNPLLDAYLAAGDLTKWRTFIRFEDCVQLSVKTEIGTAHVTTIHADGQAYLNSYDNSTQGNYVVRVKEDGSGYIVEAAVPWRDSSVAAGQIVGVHFQANSIDNTGMSPVDTAKTKFAYYQTIAAEYGIDTPYNGQEAIRQTPLYLYRNEDNTYRWFDLTADTYVAPRFRITFNLEPDNTLLVVKQNGTVIAPQADGTYLLPEGEYTWSATAKGYEAVEDMTFTVAGVKQIPVTLTALADETPQ